MASVTNTSASYAGAITRVIDKEALEVAQRYLIVYQFADKKQMETGHGTNWTATRWSRLSLPLGPVGEGVAPDAQALSFTQVTGTALQWAGRVIFTDVAVVATQHDLLHQATERLGMQMAELKERNGFNNLLAGTQVNYVNSRGARASIVAGDNLDPTTINRTIANLKLLGAPLYNGQTGETIQRSIDYSARQSEKTIKGAQHLVGISNTLCLNDLANNPLVVQTWQYSDHNRLYINEIGYWRGITFCESNIMPSWVGVAGVSASNGSGSLTTGTYAIQVTGWDTQNQYESRVYAVTTGVSVTTGGITLTTPSTPGFTYAVYVSQPASTSPANLGLCTAGPLTGPYQGQAIQLPPATSVTITGIGLLQVPPAAPGIGITVYPTFIFGQKSFACLKLENVSWNRLFEADKSDPHNQLRVIGYKFFEGWVILNQQFLARIESTASNSGNFG
jgi:N4-gp56 family major capsid protein